MGDLSERRGFLSFNPFYCIKMTFVMFFYQDFWSSVKSHSTDVVCCRSFGRFKGSHSVRGSPSEPTDRWREKCPSTSFSLADHGLPESGRSNFPLVSLSQWNVSGFEGYSLSPNSLGGDRSETFPWGSSHPPKITESLIPTKKEGRGTRPTVGLLLSDVRTIRLQHISPFL